MADEGQQPAASGRTTGRHAAVGWRAAVRRGFDRAFGGELGGTMVVAVLWGAVVAAAVWAALTGLDRLSDALWGGAGPAATGGLARGAWWLVVLLPAAGGLACGLLGRLVDPLDTAPGLDVADLIDSIGRRGGRVDLHRSLARSIGSMVAIGAGGSAGPEGPLVHLGGGTFSAGGLLFGFDGRRRKVLVACGAAAGLAAVFGTPVAAVLLSVEVVLGAVHMRTLLPVGAAAVVASGVRAALLARFGPVVPLLALPETIGGAAEGAVLAACLVVGLGAGVAGAAFARITNLSAEVFAALPIPRWSAPAVGGLLVGCIGVAWPQVLGHGYGAPAAFASAAAAGVGTVVVLGLWKFLATALTIGSGGAGGVLAPCLFLGASLGAAAGAGLEQAGLADDPGAAVGTLTLAGAAAVFAAVSHAGLTSIILILELTMQPFVIGPVFIAVAPAVVVASLLSKESIHTLALRRHGDRRTFGEASVLHETPVAALVRADAERVGRGEPLSRLVRRVVEGEAMYQHVVDENGKLLGTISLQEVGPLLREDDVEGLLLAYDVMRAPPLAVTRSDSLATALEKFARSDWDELAVVDGAGVLEGRLTRRDVLTFYAREVLDEKNLGMKFVRRSDRGSIAPTGVEAGAGGGDQPSEVVTGFVEVPPDQAIEAMVVPPGFVGHTLKDLNLRARFGVGVISMRRRASGGGRISVVAPDPTLPLREGDVLVLAGPREQVEKLKKLVG